MCLYGTISAVSADAPAVAAAVHGRAISTLQLRQALVPFWVQQDDPAVVPAARENLAVKTPGYCPDIIAVTFQGVEAFTGRRPELDFSKLAADKLRAIWRPFQAPDLATVALQLHQTLALFCVPEDDPLVIAAAREKVAVASPG